MYNSSSTNALIPLHCRSDGLISLPQFEKFYWPQLKRMLLQLIDHGTNPFCLYEGSWIEQQPDLPDLAELPEGKSMGWFQSRDIFTAKEILGDTVLIVGGVKNYLRQDGTVEQVRDYTQKWCEVVGKRGGYLMSVGIGEMEMD